MSGRRVRLLTGIGIVVLLVAVGGLSVEPHGFAGERGDLPRGPVTQAESLRPTGIAAPAVGEPGWVAAENRRPGTGAWRIRARGQPRAIEGYADRVSASAGDAVTLYVSTMAPSWHVQAYRMGWYGGARGRLLWRSGRVSGRRQSDPLREPGTNMISTHWSPSLTLQVDDRWPPGAYLLKLVAPGAERYIPLTVTDPSSNDALVVMDAVTTWEAYNDWGGRNLYWGPFREFGSRSRVVSFDRPYARGDGASDFLHGELPLISLLERAGLDATYWTDIDLHQHPELLLRHRALISLGHDEYWSTSMRRGATIARDHGVNLAFLGANAVFRHIRLQASPLGDDRQEVNYKPASARADPAWRTNPKQVTTNWREPPLHQPESSLLGQLYECNPALADGVVVEPGSWLLAGTGLRMGSRLPNLIGPEYDRVTPTFPTPRGIELVLHSPLRCRFRSSFSDVTYYSVASGAGVVDTGTSSWICQIDAVCAAGRNSLSTSTAVRRITMNLLLAFAAGPAGQLHPSRSNLDHFDTRPSGL
jgi:N,N-dimethylformamidase beta subunit-like, C-terminal